MTTHHSSLVDSVTLSVDIKEVSLIISKKISSIIYDLNLVDTSSEGAIPRENPFTQMSWSPGQSNSSPTFDRNKKMRQGLLPVAGSIIGSPRDSSWPQSHDCPRCHFYCCSRKNCGRAASLFARFSHSPLFPLSVALDLPLEQVYRSSKIWSKSRVRPHPSSYRKVSNQDIARALGNVFLNYTIVHLSPKSVMVLGIQNVRVTWTASGRFRNRCRQSRTHVLPYLGAVVE